jgi:hypothetical protein
MKIALLLIFVLVSCGHKDKKSAAYRPEIEGQEQLSMAPLDGRPAILVVGDSISIGYLPSLVANLSAFQVIHNTGNATTTRNGIAHIHEWSEHAPEWEICTINHGLHDMNTDYNISNAEYAQNLQIEIDTLKERCKKVLFITTTHVPKFAPKRSDARGIELNQAAVNLMTMNGVSVCDIYQKSFEIRNMHKRAYEQDNVHYIPQGYTLLGDMITDCIRAEI